MITPVILSGGGGTRLWPLSRTHFPKQYWPLTSDKTLLQETALRVRSSLQFNNPLIVNDKSVVIKINPVAPVP